MMLDVGAKGPWPWPLDWNLHAASQGEPRIPFCNYVQPESPLSACGVFPQFHRLPVELQLHIIHLYDTPTLSRLMQASSNIRTEAQMLF
ncbi:hypothetical protein P154DRAFT_433940 [Amniculicola lignicola CBS 123094]|uniref:F-box domain-containing protein n=1 Tax=Amniculicola lignicola CBS 123094 TaxID=1392246 RepID=A0A6A5WIU3_9PLEO|nr:hypothetical protein P154DRAFT_433940 [Amniculicola lignicola CBS 123094]